MNRIEKTTVAYINEKGIRRVGKAFEVSKDGEMFKVLHKAGYFEYVSVGQIVA